MNDLELFLTDELHLRKVKRRGDWLMFCCIWHDENNPSCGINTSSLLVNCFSCGTHGSIYNLIAEALDINILEAMMKYPSFQEYLDNGLFVDVQKEEEVVEDFTTEFYMLDDYDGSYRGITKDEIDKYQIKQDEHGIIFPLIQDYTVIGAVRRNFKGKMRYTNLFQFHKGNTFFGLEHYEQMGGEIILCEGIFDWLSLRRAGFTNVLCMLGSKITTKQVQILNSLIHNRIVLALDNDMAGVNGCKQIMRKLKDEYLVFNYDKENFAIGEDIGDKSEEVVRRGIENALFIVEEDK